MSGAEEEENVEEEVSTTAVDTKALLQKIKELTNVNEALNDKYNRKYKADNQETLRSLIERAKEVGKYEKDENIPEEFRAMATNFFTNPDLGEGAALLKLILNNKSSGKPAAKPAANAKNPPAKAPATQQKPKSQNPPIKSILKDEMEVAEDGGEVEEEEVAAPRTQKTNAKTQPQKNLKRKGTNEPPSEEALPETGIVKSNFPLPGANPVSVNASKKGRIDPNDHSEILRKIFNATPVPPENKAWNPRAKKT